MQRYAGDERTLYIKLCKKYLVDPSPEWLRVLPVGTLLGQQPDVAEPTGVPEAWVAAAPRIWVQKLDGQTK